MSSAFVAIDPLPGGRTERMPGDCRRGPAERPLASCGLGKSNRSHPHRASIDASCICNRWSGAWSQRSLAGDRRPAAASPAAYRERGQKNPRSPSPLVRGTTCTWRWATLWLTTLLLATNVPWAPRASGTAAAIRWTRSKNGPTSSRSAGSRRGSSARPAGDRGTAGCDRGRRRRRRRGGRPRPRRPPRRWRRTRSRPRPQGSGRPHPPSPRSPATQADAAARSLALARSHRQQCSIHHPRRAACDTTGRRWLPRPQHPGS